MAPLKQIGRQIGVIKKFGFLDFQILQVKKNDADTMLEFSNFLLVRLLAFKKAGYFNKCEPKANKKVVNMLSYLVLLW